MTQWEKKRQEKVACALLLLIRIWQTRRDKDNEKWKKSKKRGQKIQDKVKGEDKTKAKQDKTKTRQDKTRQKQKKTRHRRDKTKTWQKQDRQDKIRQ